MIAPAWTGSKTIIHRGVKKSHAHCNPNDRAANSQENKTNLVTTNFGIMAPALTDTTLQTDLQKALGFHGEFHGQFLQHFANEAVD